MSPSHLAAAVPKAKARAGSTLQEESRKISAAPRVQPGSQRAANAGSMEIPGHGMGLQCPNCVFFGQPRAKWRRSRCNSSQEPPRPLIPHQ